MSGIPPTIMSVVYVTSTSHIVSAVTRTDTSAPSPSLADLVGDNLGLQLGPTQVQDSGTPSIPVGTLLIPATDLALVDIDLRLLGPSPWGQAINLVGTPSKPVIGEPPVLAPLLSFVTPPGATYSSGTQLLTVTITNNPAASGSAYYIIVAQPFTVTGFPTTAKGTLTTTSTTVVTFSLLNLKSGTFPVLILVKQMLPCVATFIVP